MMNMTNQRNSTDTVEQEREQLRKEISLAEDLKSLQEDERFKRVFSEELLDRVVKYETSQLISGNEIIREVALEKIKAAKYLEAFMDYVLTVGEGAKADLVNGDTND